MPLNLPLSTHCFIDANIFYYHYIDTPPLSDPCSDLLQRVLDGDIIGATAPHVMAEAIHKVMLGEAASRFGLPRPGILGWIQRHPERIRDLREFADLAADFGRMNLRIICLDMNVLCQATVISQHAGLLTNDAITVALLRREGISNIATNDDDFDGVAGLTVWKPR